MKAITVAVECSECGKTLRGHIGITGYHVSRHTNPTTGKPCWGARRTNHKKVGQ